MKNTLSLPALLALASPSLCGFATSSPFLCATSENSIRVSYISDIRRSGIFETVFDIKGNFILSDESGTEIPYQITYDGKLIFPIDIAPRKSVVFHLAPGNPTPVDTICYGRIFPERKDDLAWENDRSAYRAYGPALQASGEKAYGYDIWTKSVPYPVLEKRFHDDIVNHVSFHIDHGEGMDVYGVGPTLGGGTPALITASDSIIYPYCWQKAEILDCGPLRFSALLTYPPVAIGCDTVIERRLITLDAGAWLNKTVVTYEGLPADIRPMAGIVVHDANPDGYKTMENAVAYCDLTQIPDADNGEIYVALLSATPVKSQYIPLPSPEGDAVGHICLIGNPGDNTFTYYWGSGWSKGGIKDYSEWINIINEYPIAQ